MPAEIKYVESGSIAEEIGLEKGDVIAKINGIPIKDVLDYRYLINDEYITLTIKTKQNTTEEVEIEKDAYEDLGVEFVNSLMDTPQHCSNKCVFCFIDQLPRGMRKSLYFKDDDTRLSFFQGNYVTLTNLDDDEIERLIRLRISPINISVHTTDSALRVEMLKNPNAGRIMDIMQKFHDNNIDMNCQIVLCPGLNDGAALQKTIFDLYSFYPKVKSVSIVPVGLTKHREGLCKLNGVNKEIALDVLSHIHFWQDKFRKETNTNFIYASDEFYLKAELPIPSPDYYDGYPQLENGVGLIASLHEDLDEALKAPYENVSAHSVTIATGSAAYKTIKEACEKITKLYPEIKTDVKEIKNHFFGESITVAGLLCAKDIITQLKGESLGDYLLITDEMLRSGSDVFLDDLTLSDVSDALNIEIKATPRDGFSLLLSVLDK